MFDAHKLAIKSLEVCKRQQQEIEECKVDSGKEANWEIDYLADSHVEGFSCLWVFFAQVDREEKRCEQVEWWSSGNESTVLLVVLVARYCFDDSSSKQSHLNL